MATYTTPGVIIEEQAATGPIAGVGTSTAAMIGQAPRGPAGTPTMITNLTRFTQQFGSTGPLVAPYQNLALAVQGFFQNGGTAVYIVRVGNGAAASFTVTDGGSGTSARSCFTVRARDEGVGDLQVAVEPATTTTGFTLTISHSTTGATETETFRNLSMDPVSLRFVQSQVAATSTLVEVVMPPPDGQSSPPTPGKLAATALAGGKADNVPANANLWDDALTALEKVLDVSLVCAPGLGQDYQAKVLRHCEALADRFAILDTGTATTTPPQAIAARTTYASDRGYGAVYHPWLTVPHPQATPDTPTLPIPPSGHIAGIYARVDARRGVHKAPANEPVVGALSLATSVDDGDQQTLNPQNVNALRVFPGRSAPVVWGARTTTVPGQTAWQYINLRRLFVFVEESIKEGIRWAVFEPNDVGLWQQLDRTISGFLTRVWSSGALFGATASEAFYVKIDDELNPSENRDLGVVVVEIGIAPVRPAEFVVVRIGLWPGGASSQEG